MKIFAPGVEAVVITAWSLWTSRNNMHHGKKMLGTSKNLMAHSSPSITSSTPPLSTMAILLGLLNRKLKHIA